MAKIADVVKLKTGYANFVNLKSAYDEAKENADRMAMYRPTKSHRKAFERLCRGIYQPADRKFYLLSGSYGTGKSHLCLMFANFLSRSSGDPGIRGFYENYEKLDSETAKMLKNIRKDGQYLVAICDYNSGKRFEEVVLKGILDACRSMKLEVTIQTEFNEAERLLEEWEKRGRSGVRNFYEDFERSLIKISPATSVLQLRSRMKEIDADALNIFHGAFKETMGGLAFQPQSGNIIPIIKGLLKEPQFKERFKGLAVLFDEFGTSTLEKAAYGKDILQGFMETLCKNEPNVIFVGCIHKDFKAYADRYSKDDAAVMSARITPVDLLNEGVEEIIGAIVEVDKESETWRQEISPKTTLFDQFLPVCMSLKLFPWLDDTQRIREKVLEDIYGIHPMALACLLKLSSEIGSDARSTFTFFSGDVPDAEGSYPGFIENAEIVAGGGKLNLYTTDMLFAFFREKLSQKNADLRERQRQAVNGYYASLDALRKTGDGDMFPEVMEERLAILRTILIYDLCQISANLENIQFGLYCLAAAERKKVENHLKTLVKSGAVFLRQQSKTYELAAGNWEDPYELIDRFLADESLHPQDPIGALLAEAGDPQELEFLYAKQFNLPFNEDKRFRRRFVWGKDLGLKLWQELHQQWEQEMVKEKNGSEGTVIYALCENEADIQIAKNAVNDIPYDNMTVSIPHSPQPFIDVLLRVKACRHYLPPNEAMKISAQTESRLRDIFESPEDGYRTQLQAILRDISSGEKACWYEKGGKALVDRPSQSHKPADQLCENLYKKHCLINHPDLNFCHDDKWRTGKNNALKQAVAVLIESERVMIDNGNPDNHGEKRYLEKALLKGAGALRKTGAEGTVTYFECEADPEKISDNYPILKLLCHDLANLPPGKMLALGNFLRDAENAPYGAGGTARILALAHLVRAFGERLRIFSDTTKISELHISSYDDVLRIVADPATKVVLEVFQISDAQRDLVDYVAKAVHAPPLKHGEIRTIDKTVALLQEWWKTLPAAAKIVDLYEKKERPRLKGLKDLLDDASHIERFDLILHRLPTLYSSEPSGGHLSEKDAQDVGEGFSADVKRLDTGLQTLQESVAEAVDEIFGVQGDSVEFERVIDKWYNELNPQQRDPLRYDDGDAYELLSQLTKSKDRKIVFFKKLPEVYGFQPVPNWTTIQTSDYMAKLRQAKAAIDEAKPTVPMPEIKTKSYEIGAGENPVIAVPAGAAKIIYTTSGEDPRKSAALSEVDGRIHLADLVKNKSSIVVKMRTLDKEGNASDVCTVEVVNKDKKYEIGIEPDLLGNMKATFKFPDNIQGLAVVMKSLLKQSAARGILTKEAEEKLEEAFQELFSEKGK